MSKHIVILLLLLSQVAIAQDCREQQQQSPLSDLQLQNCIDEMLDNPCECHAENMRRLPEGSIANPSAEDKEDIVIKALEQFEATQLQLVDSVVDIEGVFSLGPEESLVGQNCSTLRLENFACEGEAQDPELLNLVKGQLIQIAQKSQLEMQLQVTFPLPTNGHKAYRERRLTGQCKVPDAFLKHIDVTLFHQQKVNVLDFLRGMDPQETLNQYLTKTGMRGLESTLRNSLFDVLLNNQNKEQFLNLLNNYSGEMDNFLESSEVQEMVKNHFNSHCAQQDRALQKIACESSLADFAPASLQDMASYSDDMVLFFEDEPFEKQLAVVSDMQNYCQAQGNPNNSVAKFSEYLAEVTAKEYQGDLDEVSETTYVLVTEDKEKICEDDNYKKPVETLLAQHCGEGGDPWVCDYYTAMKTMLDAYGVNTLEELMNKKLNESNATINEEGQILAKADYDVGKAFFATEAPSNFFEQVLGTSERAQERQQMTPEQVVADTHRQQQGQQAPADSQQDTTQTTQQGPSWTKQFSSEQSAHGSVGSTAASSGRGGVSNREVHRRLDRFQAGFDQLLRDNATSNSPSQGFEHSGVEQQAHSAQGPTPERTVYANNPASDDDTVNFMGDFNQFVAGSDRGGAGANLGEHWMPAASFFPHATSPTNMADQRVQDTPRVGADEAREQFNQALADANAARLGAGADTTAGAEQRTGGRAPAASSESQASMLSLNREQTDDGQTLSRVDIEQAALGDDYSLSAESLAPEDVQTIRELLNRGQSFVMAVKERVDFKVIVSSDSEGNIDVQKVVGQEEDPQYQSFFTSVQEYLSIHGRTLESLQRLFGKH